MESESVSFTFKIATLGWIPIIGFWVIVLWQARENLWRFRKPIMLVQARFLKYDAT
ncbi:MAG: hypothetical protein ACXAC5_02025 [Promethearchaeota archaeon]|jgi:hypothetical protein